MTVTTVDPSTGLPLATYEETAPDELDSILHQAHVAAAAWRVTPPGDRADALRRLGASLRDRREELALIATREMGKPLAGSRAEVDKCVLACEWFADPGPAMLEPDEAEADPARAYVAYVPLGVLFAIMPWNFPYWQVVRALAPALAAGNVVVLKHAPSTTGCALRLAEVAEESGFPPGVLSVIVVSAEKTIEVSERVIADHRVAAVTLTGSTGAGRSVAAVAGRALKKTVLELGGSDPFIVLADADLEAAAAWAARSRFQNTGQSCIAAKRIILEESIADEFTERLLVDVDQLTLDIGPLTRKRARASTRRRPYRDQLDDDVRPAAAVRRRQGVRLRSGAVTAWHPRVRKRARRRCERAGGPRSRAKRDRVASDLFRATGATT